MKYYININNVSIFISQNKLSSVVFMLVQTNMSLVFWQKSAEKRKQSECSTQEDQRLQSCACRVQYRNVILMSTSLVCLSRTIV